MAKVERCTTLEELADYFNVKITVTEHCLNLQGSGKDPNKNKIFQGLSNHISELQAVIALMREDINNRKKVITAIQEMRDVVASLQDRLNAAQSNLPARLPVAPAANGHIENTQRPVEQNHVVHEEVPKANTTVKNQPTKKGKYIPSINYLMVQEFDNVPKYIKGRLTYDKMNTSVDDVNSILHGKYTLIATRKSAQNDYIRGKIISYKEEETKETKGCHFFTEKDSKEFANKKLDPTFRTVLTILRHCKRIKEVRGGGLTRYVLCN